jgi:protocatechuate 3,4-dioxygenase beta subunit
MHRALSVVLVISLVSMLPGIGSVEAQSLDSLSGDVCYTYSEAAGPRESCLDFVAGAPLTLRRKDALGGVPALEKQATSDEKGGYEFGDVPSGDYTLTVNKSGFAPFSQGVSVSGATRYEVLLTPAVVEIKGLLRDSDNRSVANARITMYSSVDGWQYHQATSAADGAFAAKLLGGHYEFNVDAPGHYPLYQRLFVDGSAIELTLERVPPQTAKIVGRVVDQNGQPVAGANVETYSCCGYARPMSGMAESSIVAPDRYPYYGNNRTTTGSDGRYQIFVDPGDVQVNVYKEGYAGANRNVAVKEDAAVTQDFTVKKFPEKTAKIVGRAVDENGKPLKFISVNVQSPEFGLWECSNSGDAPTPEPKPMDPESSTTSSDASMPYYGGCAITIKSDGSFEGMITPGYSIIQVHFDHWRTCNESRHADGSYSYQCGQDHYMHVQTLRLPADATTEIKVVLKSKPGPDATMQGYVVDAATNKAITGARVEFSHQDTWSWGTASTDEDGSYKVRVVSGMHIVRVYANGYLHWEGMVEIAKGETRLDFVLEAGDEAYGYCCAIYATAEDKAVASSPSMGGSSGMGAPGMASGSGRDGMTTEARSGTDSAGANAFSDLGGGLGPYSGKAKTEPDATAKDTPALPLLALLGVLVVVALRRRR